MKLTPLWRSSGRSISGDPPECSLLDICDLQLLLECPIDLSALSLFLPAHSQHARGKRKGAPLNPQAKKLKQGLTIGSSVQQQELPHPFISFGERVLIDAEPWYRVPSWSRFDLAMVNAVVLSNPTSMLGLPFITRNPRFSGKIFATDAAATVGGILLRELVSCHADYIQVYGPSLQSEPVWLTDRLTAALPLSLKEYLLGSDWQQLYRAEEVEDCLRRVHRLNYGEEAVIDDCVTISPLNSGFCLGAANWAIKGPWTSLAYVSASSLEDSHVPAMNLTSLKGSKTLLLSSIRSAPEPKDKKPVINNARRLFQLNRPWATATVKFVTPQNQQVFKGVFAVAEEINPVQRLCKSAIESICKGGSVLISTCVSDNILELVETLSSQLSAASLGHIRIFCISPGAEEFLAFTNIIPEWLSPARQEKLFAGEPSFGRTALLKDKLLHHSPSLSSSAFIENWQEPCVVFAAHSSLRMGAAVHLLHRWRDRPECLLILTEEIYDKELALCPFEPLSLRVLNLPVSKGLRFTDLERVYESINSVISLVPGASCTPGTSSHVFYTAHGSPVEVEEPEDELNLELSSEVANRIKPKHMRLGVAVGRLSAEMRFERGKFHLDAPKELKLSTLKQSFRGSVEAETLIKVLKDKGLADFKLDGTSICVGYPSNAWIELESCRTCIKADDPVVRRLIADAVCSLLQAL